MTNVYKIKLYKNSKEEMVCTASEGEKDKLVKVLKMFLGIDLDTHVEVDGNGTGAFTTKDATHMRTTTALKESSCGKTKMLEDEPPYEEIMDHFNSVTKRDFKSTSKETKKLINARWKEFPDIKAFKAVIDNKARTWLSDPRMAPFLRPATLFAQSKFEGYMNEKPPEPPHDSLKQFFESSPGGAAEYPANPDQ